MKHFNLIIIGGDAAGMSAASQARRINKNITIQVFEKGEYVSYAACGMPYYISGDIKDFNSLLAIDKNEFIAEKNIDIATLSEVFSVDFTAREIQVKSDKIIKSYSYDRLVIATGASAVLPDIPGINSSNVFFLRSLRHGIDIKNFISEKKPGTAILIGGGFISLELAEAMTKLNIKVTILEKFNSVASLMSPEIQKLITDELVKNGVSVSTGADIIKIIQDKNGLTVQTTNGNYTSDFIIVSAGARPNTSIFTESLLSMLPNGAVVIDEMCHTNIPDVFAAGDCATVKNLITGKNDYMPIATTANKQGRVAGLQAVNVKTEMFRGAIGTQMIKVYDLEIGKTGLNRTDAAKHGIPVIDEFIEWKSRPGYYPGSRPIFIKLTVREDNRKVIGGEIAGTDHAAIRINTIAAAVTSGMTVDDLAYLDTGYAPPFSPVWDPILAVAQNFIKRVPSG